MRSEEKCGVLHGKYELGRLLGRGTFGKVYHAKNLQTNQSVAVKVVGKEQVVRIGMIEQVKREISVMKMMHHPNIVELHEVMASKAKIYLAMEYVRGGALFAKIAKSRLPEGVARHYFRQLISVIDFCHSRGVYHRDLKPDNLLLDGCGNMKVTDFGLSSFSDQVKEDGMLHTACGTPAYIAPEVFGNKGYDGAKTDIWSCGVILYMLLAGYLPFQEENNVHLYRKICRGDYRCPSWFPSESRKLITKMLDPNPSTRITITKIMDSPWFKKPVPRSLRAKTEPESAVEDEADVGKCKEVETLNAFHIISLSEGFDLSPLFEQKTRLGEEQFRFATTRPASSVISKIEEVAKTKNFSMKKNDTCVRLQGQESGRKGKLGINANLLAVTPSLMVVEVTKSSGDTLEYNHFCSTDLRPALKDIVWDNSIGGTSTIA